MPGTKFSGSFATISEDGLQLSRRQLLEAGVLAAGTLALGLPARAEESSFALPESTLGALKQSPYVYVSPLKSNGGESRCHGEVWYFEDGGDAVLATATDTWKARALSQGLTRARIWVGDYGRVKQAGDKFRSGPSFIAEASRDQDKATFERLMKSFAGKYPDEWGKWEPRFQKGYDDGSRILIRYRAIA